MVAAAALLLLRLALPDVPRPEWRVPLSIILMDTAFAFGGVLAIRVLRRALYERYEVARRWTGRAGSPARPCCWSAPAGPG